MVYMRISDELSAVFPGARCYRLAGPKGDGRHAYCNETGAYLGLGTALVERVVDASGVVRFMPRSDVALARLLAKAYGREVNVTRLSLSLASVARALERGDLTLANIALVHAELDPLPDEAAAQRLAKTDQVLRAEQRALSQSRLRRADKSGVAKAGFNPDEPRVPAGQSGGGDWTQDEDAQVSQTNGTPRAYDQGHGVVIEYPDGSTETRHGGTIAWRNNNPGNIGAGPFADRHGAIGSAGGRAVFPDEETGIAAMDSVLRTSTYSQMSIDDAIAHWANDSPADQIAAYQAAARRATGMSGDTKVGDLSSDQFASLTNAMRRQEAAITGTVTRTGPQR
jgi:hypothetical protein